MCEWNGQDSAGDDFCLLAKPSGSPGRECPSTVHVEGAVGTPTLCLFFGVGTPGLEYQVAKKEVASRGLSGSSHLHCCQSFGHFIDLSQGCSF